MVRYVHCAGLLQHHIVVQVFAVGRRSVVMQRRICTTCPSFDLLVGLATGELLGEVEWFIVATSLYAIDSPDLLLLFALVKIEGTIYSHAIRLCLSAYTFAHQFVGRSFLQIHWP
jgi:hypothetical protein